MSTHTEPLIEAFATRDPGVDLELSAVRSFRVEHRLDFGRGCIEVRQYTWARETADVFTTADAYFLDLSLTPRPGPARGSYLDAGRRAVESLGRVMFVPPGRTVQTACANGRQRSMHCVLSTGMIEDLLPRKPSWDDAALAEGLHLSNPEIEWLLLKIYREVRQGDFGVEVMVESLANALAVALIRQFGLDKDDVRRSTGGLAPWRMRLIRERIQADQPAPGLAELADLCGMTVRHLSRAFKRETGQTIGKFVEQATIERARLMLVESAEPVGEIARRLGFASATSFAYAFRRATGLRPSEVEGRRRRRAPADVRRIN